MALSNAQTELSPQAETLPETIPLSTRPTLRRNISWTFLGTAVWSACNWLMFIALAKQSSPGTVGLYRYSIAVATPILTFAQLNLRGLQATDANRQYRFRDYLTLRCVCMLAAFALLLVLTRFGAHYTGAAWTLIWISLGIVLDSFSDIFYGLLQRFECMKRVGISMAVKGVLSLAGLGLGFHFTKSLSWAAFFSAMASAVIVLGYDIPAALAVLREHSAHGWARGKFAADDGDALALHWNFEVQKRLFWLAFPMGITMLLIALNMNICLYFIEHYEGKQALGIFAALSYLVVAGRTAIIAIGQAAYARLGQYWAQGRRGDFRSLLMKLIIVCSLLGVAAPVVALIAGKPLLTLLYKPEYAKHLAVFVMVLAAGGMGYVASILGYAITAARYIKVQIVWFGSGTLVTLLASWWLIPTQGLMGAAIATLLAAVAQLVVGLLILRHLFRHFNAPVSHLPETVVPEAVTA